MVKSHLVKQIDNMYTFYINSEYSPSNISVMASNQETAMYRAISTHYGYDDMTLTKFKKWIHASVTEFAPTSMMMHDDIVRVIAEIEKFDE